MRISEKNKRRFKDNPLEKRFADEWKKRHELAGYQRGIIDYLLAENPNDPRGEATERDKDVAAVVIQWLGSHVGQCFLEDVLKKKIRW